VIRSGALISRPNEESPAQSPGRGFFYLEAPERWAGKTGPSVRVHYRAEPAAWDRPNQACIQKTR
jgi:hypothetical protein